MSESELDALRALVLAQQRELETYREKKYECVVFRALFNDFLNVMLFQDCRALLWLSEISPDYELKQQSTFSWNICSPEIQNDADGTPHGDADVLFSFDPARNKFSIEQLGFWFNRETNLFPRTYISTRALATLLNELCTREELASRGLGFVMDEIRKG